MRRPAWLRLAVIAGIAIGLFGVAAAPAVADDAPDAMSFVQVQIDTVTPAVVTADSGPELTVAGHVTNTGDRPVRDVMVRLEQAAAVGTAAGLRTPLRGQHDQFEPVAGFRTVAAELQRGQKAHFSLTRPLAAADGAVPDVTDPGVYPLLVNVNATPDFGAPARLDDARFLLPVLAVPTGAADGVDPDASASTGDDTGGSDTAHPVALTMLWPLADRPRLAPGVPGGTVPVRLTDDELATSLAPGGRLDILLSTVEFATSAGADPGGAVARSLCLAIDPDLLVTVNAMTGGYVVPDPDDPAGATHPGAGQAAATDWLARLRALAGRLCVTPLPYAQADLAAVQRAGDSGLATIATAGTAPLVDQLLDITAVRGAMPFSQGPLTRDAADLLAGQAETVALAAAPDAAPGDGTAGSDLNPRRLSPRVTLAPFDPAVGAALAALGTTPTAPTYLDTPANREFKQNLRHDSAVARRQNALGALLWRMLATGVTPRTELLVPPATWTLHPDDAHAVLSTLAMALRSGLAVPRPLPELLAAAQSTPAAPGAAASLPEHVDRGRFDTAVTAAIGEQSRRLWGLTGALTTDPRTGLTGVAYTAPLREDMLRAVSQAAPPAARNEIAHRQLGAVTETVTHLIGGVTVVNPGGSYTLATEHSPLPLALRNDLAVPVRVRLHLDTPPGMTVTDPGEIVLPPGYLPLRVPIEVRLNQRVAVDAALSTPDGMPLGQTVRLSVHANAYGKVLFAITLSATAVLVVLAGRRLWHRFRGQPDRADLPEPRRGNGARP
ncbi:hypothetical protein BHQ15_05785 [Mycolicibacillus koreensis]|nr:hypothetical protein BHQ15_05785 [Mycolicibacillus koreensis]